MISLENNRIDYSKSKLSIFISYLMPHKTAFALDMGLSLAVALVDLVFPYVTRRTMNTLLPEQRYAAFFTVMGIVLAADLRRDDSRCVVYPVDRQCEADIGIAGAFARLCGVFYPSAAQNAAGE